uniref:Uncharacterized protein n=1 Tax=Nelumbo nucifera TaxID=4432 RepID=A0A822XH13_NELNU|nr:TPA_asm: hypothetical protein HUJ06_019864 [Nelumbo nucifera]
MLQICLSRVGSPSAEPPPPPSSLVDNVNEVDLDTDVVFRVEYESDREGDPDFELECEAEEDLVVEYDANDCFEDEAEDGDITRNPGDLVDNVEAVVGLDLLNNNSRGA